MHEKWNAINPARNENKLRVITNNSGPRKVALENCRIWNGTCTATYKGVYYKTENYIKSSKEKTKC